MRKGETYEEFQDRIFRELRELEDLHTKRIVQSFVDLAERAGLTVEDLLGMLDSGMKVPDLFEAVCSRLSKRGVGEK